MTDYISREAALETLNMVRCAKSPLDVADAMIRAIRAMPAADVEPAVHGHWNVVQRHEHYPSGKPYSAYYCSVCGMRSVEYGQYCLHCGAKMIYTEVDA